MSSEIPNSTRLRYVSAKDPKDIEKFFDTLQIRVRIHNAVWNDSKKRWYVWFVPPDEIRIDVKSIDL